MYVCVWGGWGGDGMGSWGPQHSVWELSLNSPISIMVPFPEILPGGPLVETTCFTL